MKKTLQSYFAALLREKTGPDLSTAAPELTMQLATRLLERVNNVKLYAHSYAFVLNFTYGSFDIYGLLDFAHQEGLAGISIHIDSGGPTSLRNMSQTELSEVQDRATSLGLGMHLELSTTAREDINCVVDIARRLAVNTIRIYLRYGGRVSSIIERGLADLQEIAKLAKLYDLHFVLEQHEDLKSCELVDIIQRIDSPRVQLLFDFGNMINACEEPLEALHTMAPCIRHVHLKGVKKVSEGLGFAHHGAAEGEDDLPQMMMIFVLLLLGEQESQIKIFSLEQVIGYYAPAYRSKNEEADPVIPTRGASRTILDPTVSLSQCLLDEKRNSCKQLLFVRRALEQFKTIAELRLLQGEDVLTS